MPEALESSQAPVSAPGRRERNKRAKLDRIVLAASELFRAHGFEATTGRQICEAAGIGTGTLFLYVRDKRELLFLIFEPRARRAFDRLPLGLRDGEDLVDGLMSLFGALMRVYGRDPRISRLFVEQLLFRSDPVEGMQTLSDEFGRRVARIVADAVERGQIRADVGVEKLGNALVAHYVLWIQLWLGRGTVGRRAAETGLRGSLELQREGLVRGRSTAGGGERNG